MILVACPTAECKAYAAGAWLDAYMDFSTSERAMFQVDNTPGTLTYTHSLRARGIPAEHVQPLDNFWDTMEASWQAIVARARDIGAEWIASVEADMVCPPETLEVLLAHSGGYRCIAHSYPARDAEAGLTVALGCTLISTDWLWQTRYAWQPTMEQYIFSSGANRELHGLLDITHLDG